MRLSHICKALHRWWSAICHNSVRYYSHFTGKRYDLSNWVAETD